MIRNLSSQNLTPILPKNQEIKTSVQPINNDLSFNQVLQGKLSKTDLQYYGVTFETQGYPIGHNESFKEHNILRANEPYVQKTKWKFTTR